MTIKIYEVADKHNFIALKEVCNKKQYFSDPCGFPDTILKTMMVEIFKAVKRKGNTTNTKHQPIYL